MRRFWDTIIAPILERVQPTSIIEIGSDQGHNTAKLLEFCKQQGATLHAIDPLPRFDVAAWREQYGQLFVFHPSLSLNALPKVDRFDVVLIDGDHNWYTVFHELKLIEKRCTDLSQPFPLVMLHDIGWPYGRRDLYYNPDNIPDVYRKPYQKKGMQPGIAELMEKGGLNASFYNAIYEHSLQNGVLTAVEDFLKEAIQPLHLIQIPGLHGLGILLTKELMERNLQVRTFLQALELSPPVVHYIEKVEGERIKLDILRLEHSAALRAQEAEVTRLQNDLQAHTINLQAKDTELERVRKELQINLQAKDTELERVRKELQEQHIALRAREAQRMHAEKEQQLSEKEHQLSLRDSELRQKEQQLSVRDSELRQNAQDITQLMGWIEQLDHGFQVVLDSNRWKLGHTLGALYRKIRFKPPMPMPQEYWHNIMERFETWRRIFESRPKLEEKSHWEPEVPASSSLGSQVYLQEPKKKP
jgi:hypothetical protein